MARITKTVYISSNGCPENLMDCGLLHQYLVDNDWHIAKTPEEAYLILFNACALTGEKERNSLARIEHFQSLSNGDSRLHVWGCLPKIHPEALKTVYKGPCLRERELLSQIDAFTKAECPIAGITNNKAVYPEDFGAPDSWASRLHSFLRGWVGQGYREADERLDLYRPGDHIYYIKTCSGCLGYCTYCAVRLSRGTIQSKSLEGVVAEFKAGLAAGYQEFSLMGTDIGCYGRDKGYTLCDLLQELVKENGNYKIGIRNINPAFMNQLIDGLEPILKTGRIWFLGCPVESGSNRILRLMGRRYTVEEYRECCRRLKAAWPKLVIRNQMMVGFPTETRRDFAASMKLIQDLGVDHNEVYAFSRRPGTAAARLKDQLPSLVINFRYYRMLIRVMWKQRKVWRPLEKCEESTWKSATPSA